MSLQLTNVQAGYGAKVIVHDASLRVDAQEIVALVGPNGAGKSTLLNSIFGIAQVRRGDIRWNGANIKELSPATIVKAGISYAPQGALVYRSMTVAENLALGGYAAQDRGAAAAQIDKAYELFPVLYERRHGLAGALSGGERQMLAMAAVLAAGPRLVLLDEPSGGLAPVIVETVFNAIRHMSDEFALSVLLVEQNLQEALGIADRAYVLSHGRIVFEADRRDFGDRQRFEQEFFGLSNGSGAP